MGFRDDLARRAEKKRMEIAELQARLREANSYLQALEDTLKMIPRDDGDGSISRSGADLLRPNSAVAKARDLIRKAGKPLHIEELLHGLGRPVNKGTRAALSGSISTYVRKGEIFTKTAPNTFGLKEMKETARDLVEGSEDDIPDSFGFHEEDNDEDEENIENAR